MDTKVEGKSIQQQFREDYKSYRQKLNMFAKQRGLSAKINEFLVADMEAHGFNHLPYVLNMGVGAIAFFSGSDLTLLNDGID